MSAPFLRIAQLSPDTDAEGPGRRFAIWVQGCAIRCPGCCNPEMFATGGREVPAATLAQEALATPDIDGITVLGGEPFDQAAAVGVLCQLVHDGGGSVVVFTGYTREALERRGDPAVDALLSHIDLLIDGRYDHTRPESALGPSARRWVGSTNQRFHFLTDRYRMSDPQFWTSNTVEIRFDGVQIVVNGWPADADALFGRS